MTRKATRNMPSEVLATTRNGQRGALTHLLRVGRSDLGIGVFATARLRRGQRILAFSGPKITFQEAVAKGDFECYPLQVSARRYIDLTAPGSCVNHSCEPNSGIRNGRLLVAVRNIESGEEIRYDYSTTMDENYFTMRCKCKAPTCRGVVTDFALLPRSRKEFYLERRLVMPFIAKQYAFSAPPRFRTSSRP